MTQQQDIRIAVTTSYQSQPIRQASDDVSGLEKAVGKLAKVASGALVGAGTAVGAFAAESIKSFTSFDRGMREVFTLLPQLSDQAMGAMTNDVQEFMAETGRLGNEVVPALYQSISAGVPADNVFDFLRTANAAALGGVADLETAVDGLSSVVNAYGSDVISATEASDLMFTAVKGGKLTFEELSRYMFQALPTFAAVDLGFENLTAAAATLTAQGTPTSVAMTQIRAAVVEMSKEGTKAAEVFERIAGKSFREFVAEGGNLQDALAIMVQGAAKAGVGVNDLFSSVEAGSAALALTGSGARKFASELDAAAASMGATEGAAETMSGSLQLSFDKAAASLDVLKTKLGEQLAPALVPALEMVVAVVDELLQKLNSQEGQGFFKDLQTGAEGFFGSYRRQAEEMVQARMAEAQSVEDYIVLLNDLYAIQDDLKYLDAFTLGGNTDVAARALDEAMRGLITTMAQQSDGFRDWMHDSIAVVGSYENLKEATAAYREELGGLTIDEYYSYLVAVQEATAADQLFARYIVEKTDATADDTAVVIENTTAVQLHDSTLRAVSRTLREHGTAIGETTIQQEENYWATLTLEEAKEQMIARLEELNALTEEEAAALAEATAEAERQAEVFSLLSGIIRDMQDPVADLIQAQHDLANAPSWDTAAIEDAQGRIEAANTAIAESYRDTALEIAQARIAQAVSEGGIAALDAQISFIQLQEAMGLIGPEEAAALEEIARVTAAVAEVTGTMLDEFLAKEGLSIEESEKLAAAITLIEENGGNAATAMMVLAENGVTGLSELESMTTTATDAIIDLKDAAQDADGTYQIEIETNAAAQLGTINELAAAAEEAAGNYAITFDISTSGSGIPGGTEIGGAPVAFSAGGRVRGGRQGIDSVPALLTPDEIVIPTTHSRSLTDAIAFLGGMIPNSTLDGGGGSLRGGDSTTTVQITNHFNAPVTDSAVASLREAQEELVEEAMLVARARGNR
ncbi:MAG: phage tail tape measure protein [Anaerolinea sp.]|nr:phage tail tape measure protein [Anaerolinea sp.]